MVGIFHPILWGLEHIFCCSKKWYSCSELDLFWSEVGGVEDVWRASDLSSRAAKREVEQSQMGPISMGPSLVLRLPQCKPPVMRSTHKLLDPTTVVLSWPEFVLIPPPKGHETLLENWSISAVKYSSNRVMFVAISVVATMWLWLKAVASSSVAITLYNGFLCCCNNHGYCQVMKHVAINNTCNNWYRCNRLFWCSKLYCHIHYFMALDSIDTYIVSWQWSLLPCIYLHGKQPYSYE
jgi:hypothetical protein